MTSLFKVLVGILFGKFVINFTVDTEKFLFHACFQGEHVVTFKKYTEDGKSKWYIQRLESCSPYIPYGLSRAKYWRVLTAFAFKGTCKNLMEEYLDVPKRWIKNDPCESNRRG